MGRDSERGYRGSCRVVWYIDVMLLCFRMTFDSSLEGQQWVETLREAIEEAVASGMEDDYADVSSYFQLGQDKYLLKMNKI